MRLKPLLKGALTFVPGLGPRLHRRSTGGSTSAEYCFGVWLKHLTLLWAHGDRQLPRTLVELGPGDSLGIGLAAMLSGVDHYYALDAVRYAAPDRTLQVFDRLVQLFQATSPRPARGWPDYDVHLDASLFPGHILTPDVLAHTLAAERLAAIRAALGVATRAGAGAGSDGRISIGYIAPWSDATVVPTASVDLVLSHTVLQHVNDLDPVFAAMRAWLKPGGYMSHQLDYTGMELCRHWNGYRACPEWLWHIVRGRRPYLINREPHSGYLRRLRDHGFEITCELTDFWRQNSIQRSALAQRWTGLPDTDLHCAQAFLQARLAAST